MWKQCEIRIKNCEWSRTTQASAPTKRVTEIKESAFKYDANSMCLLDGCVVFANGLCTVGSLSDIPHLEGIVTTPGKYCHIILKGKRKKVEENGRERLGAIKDNVDGEKK